MKHPRQRQLTWNKKVQQAKPADDSPPLSKEEIKRIQQVVGAFAWYARAVDTKMSKTLSSIARKQAKATQKLKCEVKWFLDYCSTHPDATIRFMASDMILALYSDGSHLSEADSKSRAAGHFSLTNNGGRDTNNGAILALSKIIKMQWAQRLKQKWHPILQLQSRHTSQDSFRGNGTPTTKNPSGNKQLYF